MIRYLKISISFFMWMFRSIMDEGSSFDMNLSESVFESLVYA